MRPMRQATLFVPILVVALFGCGPSTFSMRSHLAKDSFELALDEARGDPDLEDHLAAIILEKEAVENPRSAYDNVRFLAASGNAGRRSLEEMEGGEGIPALLAWIGLRRSRVPGGDDLEKLLAAESWDVRAYAVSSWARRIDAGPLRKLAVDADPRIRLAAITALGAAGSEEDAELLAEALRVDPDPAVRMAAARNGKALGPRAFEVLRAALEDERIGVRNAAFIGLSRLGNEDAVALLEGRISGELDESGVIAAACLSATGSAKGRERFEDALVDRRPGIRATALVNLSRAGLDDRDDRLLAALEDESERVVFLAASMLLGEEAAGEAVATALRRIANEAGPGAPRAVDMLAVLGDPDSVEAVLEIVGDGDQLLLRLPRLKGAEGIRGGVVELLADERGEVRTAAARWILRSGPT